MILLYQRQYFALNASLGGIVTYEKMNPRTEEEKDEGKDAKIRRGV